jgi:uncharacterized GH25 family protein
MRHAFRWLAVLCLPAAVWAHDTWLVPASYRLRAGESVRLRLATSEAFPTSEVAATPDRIARFDLRDAQGTRAVGAYRVEGEFLVAEVAAARSGHTVVVAETRPRLLVMEPAEFTGYLEAEELRAVLAARAAAPRDAPGRERYRKIAKTVLCVDGAEDKTFRDALGLWLEIVPETSPCRLRVGSSMTARVLFKEQPLRGARLVAGYEGVTGHHYPVHVVTDAEGRGVIRLERAGSWFLRVLHMVPAADDAEADWHSAFSTLTFEVQP